MRRIGDRRVVGAVAEREEVDREGLAVLRSAARRARLVWPTVAFGGLLTIVTPLRGIGWRGRMGSRRAIRRQHRRAPSVSGRAIGHLRMGPLGRS
jgi:hypothetical protein